MAAPARCVGLSSGTVAMLVAMVVATAGCARAPEPPVRVATVPWPGYQPLHLAQSLGYLDSTQVRLVEMLSATQVMAAMRAGTVDAATVTLDEALGLLQDGVALRIVLVMDGSSGADVVLARPDIKNSRQLRGKRVGVEAAAVGAVMLDAVLSDAGLTPADIFMVTLPVDRHAIAYRSGQVDAVVTYEPTRSQLLALGAHVVFDSRRIPGRIIDVLAVRTEAVTEHALALRALVAAHFRALGYIASEPQDAARRIAPYLRVTEGEVRPQFDGLTLTTLTENWTELNSAHPDLLRRAAALDTLMFRRHLLRQLISLPQLVDPQFLPAVAP